MLQAGRTQVHCKQVCAMRTPRLTVLVTTKDMENHISALDRYVYTYVVGTKNLAYP